jgi:RNA polymerase sigma factor (sigma-70 family)
MTDAAVPSSPAAATREAFGEVMRANIDLVYSAALRQVGDAHLAQDVTQAVFIVLMKKWDRLGRNRALEGWLIKTTRFVAADARKQLRRQKIHEQKAAGMRRSDAAVEESEDGAALERHLDAGLAQLGEADRSAITLRFLKRQPFAAVGGALGVSEDLAKKRVTRALKKAGGSRRPADHGGKKTGGNADPPRGSQDDDHCAP